MKNFTALCILEDIQANRRLKTDVPISLNFKRIKLNN
jgi:hypothetical protein